MIGTYAEFSRRVALVIGLTVLAFLLVFILWLASEVLLLIFAGVLVACLLRGMGNFLCQRTPLSQGWALAVVVLSLAGSVFLAVWFLSPHVAAQAEDLSLGLQESVNHLQAVLANYSWGRRLLEQAPDVADLAQRGNLLARVTGIFSSTFNVLANIVLVVFIGFYLAVAPGLYTSGVARLFPRSRRARIREVLQTVGETLGRWLVGRALLMFTNGLLTTVGLWLLGIPMAITLGIIAGLLNFVPNIGPIIAGIPAVLIGWTLGPMPALYVFLLYLALQSADGYIFTPLVQQRTVALAPALTISAQLLFGVLAGAMGVFLATPLTAVAVVLVQKLYLEDVLGDAQGGGDGRKN